MAAQTRESGFWKRVLELMQGTIVRAHLNLCGVGIAEGSSKVEEILFEFVRGPPMGT
jgi:hypothetical protein